MIKLTDGLTPEENLAARAELFKALGHPVRLLMLNLIRMKPRHGEELAVILDLNPATISHHLSKLTDVGLLTSQKDQYYQVYSLVSDVLKKPIDEVVDLPQEGLRAHVEEDAYRRKVMDTFFRHGRLVELPSQNKKKLVVLDHVLQEFEPEKAYTEHEVNQILLEFHEDVATLRRALVNLGWMTRTRDGRTYRRASEAPLDV